MEIIITPRLVLREFELEDSAFLIQLLNSPGWLKFVGDRGVKTIDQAKDYILNKLMASYKSIGYGFFLVEIKNTKLPIGTCGLVKREILEDTDIGFAFLPEYEGMGYAFEAATATMNFALQHLGLKRIIAVTDQHNNRCIQLLTKIGLKYERNVRFNSEELRLYSNTL